MTTVISSNFYLTSKRKDADNNAPLLCYKNIVTPNTLTATSETMASPATNMANPATAFGWVAGDQPAVADAITYDGVNAMPSPFDPSGWYGNTVDPDGTITNVTLANASGESFLGLAERTGSGGFNLTGFPTIETDIGDNLAGAMLFRKANALGSAFRFRLADSSGFLADIAVTSDTGTYVAGGLDYKITALGSDVLIEFKYTTTRDSGTGVYCQSFIWTDDNSGEPPIGGQLYVQAAYFGKADDYPANIFTAGVIPDQTITLDTAGQVVDYIGIARHNLNQVGLTVAIKYNGITVVEPQAISEKQALLFLNNQATPDTIEIIISGATVPPRISVLYAGEATKLERSIYVGHTPITMGRQRTAINGVSENGQYLGEIVVREVNTTSVALQNLTPLWYRNNLDPYFALSPRPPCFWAWRPSTYEAEVGYVWVEGSPRPVNQRGNGMMSVDWNFKGLV